MPRVGPGCVVLANPSGAVQVSGGAVAQHLGEASSQVEGVLGGHAVHHLAEPVAQAVVGIAVAATTWIAEGRVKG